MVKKNLLSALAAALLLSISACGPTQSLTSQSSQSGQSSSASQAAGMLGSLLEGLISNSVKVTEKTLQGTWIYQSPACRFTSEDALTQAGGAVAATTAENKLNDIFTKAGIVQGSTKFTFNSDNTCSVEIGGKSMGGTYSLNSESRNITIAVYGGLVKFNGKVFYSGKTLSVLFDANKLLSTIQIIAAFTSKSDSMLGSLASMLGNVDGMMIGMNFTR